MTSSGPQAKDGTAAETTEVQPYPASTVGNNRTSGTKRRKPHRVINIGPWGNWGSSLLFIGLLPLFPMFAEWWDKHEVGIATLTITAAIYGITVGISSRWFFMLIVGIVVGVIEALTFGSTITAASVKNPGSSNFLGMVITSSDSSSPPHAGFTLIVIVCFLASVAVERCIRHMIDREEFFEFVRLIGA